MADKDRAQLAAVIDIGSSILSMEIAQAGGVHPQELDYLEHPVNLGYESFNHGRVSFRTLEEIARVIDGYLQVCATYGIEEDAVRITATTALREAANAPYVLDQLRVRTGRTVQVLEDGQEMTLIYKEMLRRLDVAGEDARVPMLMAYIGTGSVGIAALRQGDVVFARNVRVGSLKLSQMLGQTGERTPRFHLILEEYLAALTRMLRDQMAAYRPERFVVCGKEIELVAELTHTEERNGLLRIPRATLGALYDEVKHLSPAQVVERYGLRGEQAEVLMPSLAIYLTLAEFTGSGTVVSPSVSLGDWLLYESLYPKEAKEWNRRFEGSVVASAWEMAALYQTDRAHAALVERLALQIFDCLRKVHGFSRRERLLLQTSAVLHDIGKFVNSKYHDVYACHLIMDSNLVGLTTADMVLVGNICRYHGGTLPSMSHREWAALRDDERLTASKLAAILRIADGLDRSHTQKLNDVTTELVGNELIITGRTDRDTTLEEWSLGYKGEFFTEVFGLRPTFHKTPLG